MVLHKLGLMNVSWEDFISHEVFTSPQVPPSVFHEAGKPSHQQDVHETQTTSVPVFVTYQKGTRRLFAAAKRVLSPPGVEGVSLTSSTQRVLSPHHVERVSPSSSTHVQIQDRGKRPMFDEGPSGGQDTDIIDLDASSPSLELKEII